MGKSNDYLGLPSSQGARIFIYNQSTLYSESEGVDIPAGFETSVILKKQITVGLLQPYTQCSIQSNSKISSSVNDTEYLDLFDKLGLRYRSNDCLNFCKNDLIINRCNCIDNDFKFFNLRNLILPRFCDWSSHKDVECYKVNNNDIYNTCIPKCPFECDFYTLSISSSTAKFPTKSALNDLLQSSDYLNSIEQRDGDLTSKVMKVNIYYENLSYEMLSESAAMTVITLLGGLGGTLGKHV